VIVLALMLIAAQPTPLTPPDLKARAAHADLFVYPVLKDVVDAIRNNDESKFAQHMQTGAMLIDADGKLFPLRASTLHSLVSNCTFQAMAYNSNAIFDDGIVYWNCPAGLSQLHFKMRDGVVVSASPFRDPATEGKFN